MVCHGRAGELGAEASWSRLEVRPPQPYLGHRTPSIVRADTKASHGDRCHAVGLVVIAGRGSTAALGPVAVGRGQAGLPSYVAQCIGDALNRLN